MKYINARFSYERRVKLILICIVPIAAAILLCSFPAFSEDYTVPSGKINLLRTSAGDDNFSIFETAKNTISARGKYAGDRLRKIFIDNDSDDISGSYSMKAHNDGGYEAQLTIVPPEEGPHKLTLRMNSGATMRYFIFYDSQNGWYFPKNDYYEQNRSVFGHIFEAPAEAAALYLSPTKDADEITTALEQIKMLAEEQTAGLDDDYEKARAISRFISERVYYDMDARDTNVDVSTIALCNVLKTARTVCAGFTNLFCAMAESVGIDAVNISGGCINGEMKFEELENGARSHEWSAFYYEKEERWVWVDSCWDGAGEYRNGEWKAGKPKYMYFDISDEALALNHRADKAERRHYYEAKAETEPLGAVTIEGIEKQPVITSQQTESSEPAPDTTIQPGLVLQDETKETPAPDESDTVYIIVIAALSAAVVIVGAILISIIVKGRKK